VFILENILSRTSRPISIKLGTKYPWVKEINSSDKRPGPLQRGDNQKNSKMGSGLKAQVNFSDRLLSVVRLSDFYIFDFSRTSRPIVTKVGINHPYVKGIQNCSHERQTLLQGETKAKELKYVH
jgi:hypothetical protein